MICSCRRAFSLIELLIVISLIGVLFGLLLSAVQTARGAAVRLRCQNNQRQLGLAVHSYHDRHGHLPATVPPHDPASAIGWMAHILADIEQDRLYADAIAACLRSSNSWSNPPHSGLTAIVPVFVCPADGRLSVPQIDHRGVLVALASYLATVGVAYRTEPLETLLLLRGVLGLRRLNDVADGLSNSVMIGERPPPDSFQAGAWYPTALHQGAGPNGWIQLGPILRYVNDHDCPASRLTYFGPGRTENPCDRFHLWSLHSGGANFTMADGSVRFISYSARPMIPALVSDDGGEVVDWP